MGRSFLAMALALAVLSAVSRARDFDGPDQGENETDRGPQRHQHETPKDPGSVGIDPFNTMNPPPNSLPPQAPSAAGASVPSGTGGPIASKTSPAPTSSAQEIGKSEGRDAANFLTGGDSGDSYVGPAGDDDSGARRDAKAVHDRIDDFFAHPKPTDGWADKERECGVWDHVFDSCKRNAPSNLKVYANFRVPETILGSDPPKKQ